MEKYTDTLKAKHKGSKKGLLYLWVLRANELALANDYNHFDIDKSKESRTAYINNRIEEIFNEKTGAYWKEDYKGYKELLEKGSLACPDVQGKIYNFNVVIFVETAIKSYLPKGEVKVVEVIKTREFEPNEQVIIPEKMTGEQLVRWREMEIEGAAKEEEEIDSFKNEMNLLNDEESQEENFEEEKPDFNLL